MLTEAEKKWLEKRKPPTKQPYKTTADDNFCRYCARYNTHCTPWFRDVAYCPTDQGGDFKDAAEFESRMVAKLAFFEDGCTPCSKTKRCPFVSRHYRVCPMPPQARPPRRRGRDGMTWTTEAPRADHVGHFFWMKSGDEPPKVVLITRWTGKSTMYVGIAECLDPKLQTVYMREIAIAYAHNPTPLTREIMEKTMWAGPIEPPSE